MRSLGGFLGEDQADAAAIGSGLAGGGVVHLEHQVGACFDELGLAGRQRHGDQTWRKTDEQFGRRCAIVGLLLFFSSVVFLVSVVLFLFGDERDTGLGFTQPLGTGFTHERDNVMHQRAIPGARFGGPHPGVLREAPGDHDVLILDCPGGRHCEIVRHLEHGVGLAYGPAIPHCTGAGGRLRSRLPLPRHPPRRPVCSSRPGSSNGCWRTCRSGGRRTMAASYV
jgi:hypothetical protein